MSTYSSKGLGNGSMANLSIDLGRFSADIPADKLTARFEQIKPLVADLIEPFTAAAPWPNVSTCLLIDDASGNIQRTPQEVMDAVQQSAKDASLSKSGIFINYIGFESGLTQAEHDSNSALQSSDYSLADLIYRSIVPLPRVGDNGSRPSRPTNPLVVEWPTNIRNSDGSYAYIRKPIRLFTEIEGPTGPIRVWTPPFLATVWGAAQLGLQVYDGKLLPIPHRWNPESQFYNDYRTVPAVVQQHKNAAPLAARNSVTIRTEADSFPASAVSPILSQIALQESAVRLLGAAPGELSALPDRHKVIVVDPPLASVASEPIAA